MKAPADKSPEPQRQTTAQAVPQQPDRSDAEVQFIDNREETYTLHSISCVCMYHVTVSIYEILLLTIAGF